MEPLLAPDPAKARLPWDPDRLGVVCNTGKDERTARASLSAARDANFLHAQISFAWTEVSPQYLAGLPRWLKSEAVQAPVLSAYVNACRPEAVLMDTREEDFVRAIDVAGSIGARTLVAWTGGYEPALMKPHPRNFTPEAEDNIVRFVERHARRLEAARLALALETYITLACPDAPSLRRVLNRLPNWVGAVMDPPNLTPVARFPERDQAMREMFGTLAGRIAVVHMKDFVLAPGGKSYKLPGPAAGSMNYKLYARHILALPPDVPLIAEHIQPKQFGETRGKLGEIFREARDA